MTVADATFKQTLRGLLKRWDEADNAVAAAQAAQGEADRERAERSRLEAEGAIWALKHDLSDLHFMLLRCAIEHDPQRLRDYLMDLIGADLAEAVTRIGQQRGKR